MANRSDFQSTFPRQLKRLWSLTKHDDEHAAGEWKRDFIAAHKIHKEARNKAHSRRDVSIETDSQED